MFLSFIVCLFTFPFTVALGTLQDIDECDDKSNISCYGNCINTEGSYNCTCWPGYTGNAKTQDGCQPVAKDSQFPVMMFSLGYHGIKSLLYYYVLCYSGGKICDGPQDDINECKNPKKYPCYGVCVNTRGSYNCTCPSGYNGNAKIKNDCQDINECENPEKYPCYGVCINTLGSYDCMCRPGYNGNAKIQNGCKRSAGNSKFTTIIFILAGVVLGIGILVLSIVVYKLIHKREDKRRKEIFFKRNGDLHTGRVAQKAASAYEGVQVIKISHCHPFRLYKQSSSRLFLKKLFCQVHNKQIKIAHKQIATKVATTNTCFTSFPHNQVQPSTINAISSSRCSKLQGAKSRFSTLHKLHKEQKQILQTAQSHKTTC
ncbi:EGF-like domain-containing protein [Artemisia annua]|uniref:EGF-like domain-containing protein n=1 Tax=Artemisia annua TaxID=35608 RepID=A0A2U1L905_ARTAN|nr:EGF-like domain-containing protein [Artemisia annua]